MADAKGVLVFGEGSGGSLASTDTELLAAGRKLAAALGDEVTLALLGADLGNLPREGIAFGADTVYAVTDPLLTELQPDAYVAAAERLCRERSPRVVLLAKTALGRVVGPRLAARLDTGLLQDCIELAIADQQLVGQRPVYGGSAIASVACTGTPAMAVVRPKTVEPLARDASRSGQVVPVQPHLDASALKARLVQRVEEKQEGVRLEDAAIVVSGGRGLGGAEQFEQIRELAGVLKGAWGSSRAVVDLGWVPYAYQVGLTGKSISPNLYITVAISGASQHMAGCTGAKNIVAINKDKDANIFKAARFGVVGDWSKVLPAFTAACKELVQ